MRGRTTANAAISEADDEDDDAEDLMGSAGEGELGAHGARLDARGDGRFDRAQAVGVRERSQEIRQRVEAHRAEASGARAPSATSSEATAGRRLRSASTRSTAARGSPLLTGGGVRCSATRLSACARAAASALCAAGRSRDRRAMSAIIGRQSQRVADGTATTTIAATTTSRARARTLAPTCRRVPATPRAARAPSRQLRARDERCAQARAGGRGRLQRRDAGAP